MYAVEVSDQIMIAHSARHPEYNWHSNKGYGCPKHLMALREFGPTPLHRYSFAPVAQASQLDLPSVLAV